MRAGGSRYPYAVELRSISILCLTTAATGCLTAADPEEMVGRFEITRHTRNDAACEPTDAPLAADQRTAFPRSPLLFLEPTFMAEPEESHEREYRACASTEFCDDEPDDTVKIRRADAGAPWIFEVAATREDEEGCVVVLHRGEVAPKRSSWSLDIERLEGPMPAGYACALSPEVIAELAASLPCTALERVEAKAL